MKHARKDYDRIQDPAGKIPEDEPVFLIRGQDRLGAEIVLEWLQRYQELNDCDPAVVAAVSVHLGKMTVWPKKKTADMPSEEEDDILSPCQRSLASTPQPPPHGEGQIVVDVVINDLRKRSQMGLEKYGILLRTGNGRDPSWDAYQEALDLCMYLRQALLEKEGNTDA